jgi:hypothetical protein
MQLNLAAVGLVNLDLPFIVVEVDALDGLVAWSSTYLITSERASRWQEAAHP